MITYRKATAEDIRPALDLTLKVFNEFEAADYEPEASVRFNADVVNNQEAIRLWVSGERLMFVALDGDKVVGVIGEKWNNGHINIVFVDGKYHRRGIATELMNRMVCELKLRDFSKITLFSSPYGLPFYKKYGFVETGDEQKSDGFVFTPVAYEPNEIWDVLDGDGNKTGRYHERGRKQPKGDYHLVVDIWKYNAKGEWLIDKRSSQEEKKGGFWETTGGAAIAGDDSLTAAMRETKEELGITLDPAKGALFRRFIQHASDGHGWFHDVWVFEHDCPIEDIRFQAEETCEAMWATADTVREMLASGQFFNNWFLSYFDEMVKQMEAAK